MKNNNNMKSWYIPKDVKEEILWYIKNGVSAKSASNYFGVSYSQIRYWLHPEESKKVKAKYYKKNKKVIAERNKKYQKENKGCKDNYKIYDIKQTKVVPIIRTGKK